MEKKILVHFTKLKKIATELLSEYIVPMANMGLTDEEVDSVLLYLEAQDAS